MKLVLLTYMHILHTTGDTNRELDLSLLHSVSVSESFCLSESVPSLSSLPQKDKKWIMCTVKQREREGDVEIVCNDVYVNQ